MNARTEHEHAVALALSTITSKAEHLLCAPTLINTRNGEDKHRNGGRGQEPRALDIRTPYRTITAQGSQGALVSAFLAKHNDGWRQGAGVALGGPMHTVTSRDHHAITTSHLLALKGSTDAGVRAGTRTDAPLPTVQAHGLHLGEVRAFLIRYYSEGGQWGDLKSPLATLTTRDRIGLVQVRGEDYVIADIGMRMLVPRELYRGQGFPDSYIIAPLVQSRRTSKPKLEPLSQEGQVEMCGNSVPPHMAKAMVLAQFVERYEEAVA